ncbi:autotransporter-associated beta strand repeat-containing protein [Frateuria hangzhouensis]|uniref:autotransporter-associated beta strand repeat-containing protein n=1 Tax=Frateuria hangzhouensis TaxID=2995589 RepID=UPI002260E985|nr:autotransporter-associated beta strand repeat-containing protein [Frateuria sp. STR12]MCX7513819.1 autotransporter-associated beta strand repeat-containing protein [Frateuria sp. STR12]
MNKIFRIVWNKALRQFMVASELARSPRAGATVDARSGSAPGVFACSALALALLAAAPLSLAHTTSVGYVAPLGTSGTITFWYGTYHPIGTDSAGSYEGHFELTGDNGFSATADFSQIVGAGQLDPNRPIGLEDGVNNFYALSDAGTDLSATPGSTGEARTWEGVTFSGLTAGTYTYMYVPADTPTDFWHPYAPVLSNTLVVTAADLNGFPMLPGETYTQDDPELNQPDSIVFNGGTYAPTTDTTNDQQVTIRSGGGTVDTGTGDVIFTGGVEGTGPLTKTGDGTLTLEGPSSYTGGTTVNGGTLQGDTDSLQGDITNHATVDFDQSTDGTFAGDMTGTGGLVKDGGGTLVLSGDNSYSGGTTVNGGTLQGDSASLQGDITNHATVDFDQSADGTYDGDMTGTGGLLKNGSGTLVLSGDNSYSGGTTVNDGTLRGDSASLQGDITNDATVDFDQSTDGTYAGDMSGTGGLAKNGTGTLLLTGDNTYAGGTTVNDGRLQGDSGSLRGDITNNATVDFDQATDGIYAGDMSGSGELVKNGSGTLALDGTLAHGGGTTVNDGTLVLNGNNSYTGGTTLNGGTLEIGSDANLGDAGSGLVFDGGTLHTTGNVSTDRDITLSGDGAIDTDTGTTLTATDAIAGSGELTKQGSGTLVLGGANTYTGGTTIAGGTLQGDSHSLQGDIANNGTLDFAQATNGAFGGAISGSGQLVKEGGGTLLLTGANSYSGGTTIAGGTLQGDSRSLQGDIINNGTLDFAQAGNGVFAGSIDGSGTLVKDGSGTLTLGGTASHLGGTVVNAGTLVLGGDNSYAGGTTINGGTLQVGHDANLGDASSGLTLNGGTLHTTGSFQSDRDITVRGGGFAVDKGTTFTSGGAIGGSGALVKNGQGTMVVDGTAAHHGGTTVNAGKLVLKGNNSYTGGTTLNGGSLQVGSDASLGATSGTITFNGGDLTVTQSMASDRDMVIQSGNASITTLAGATFTAHGDMSGTGGLVKRGGGVLVVTGSNTFTGGALIDGGVVRIDSGSSLGTGVIVLQGGTLQTVDSLGTGQTVLVSGNSGVNTDTGTTTELSGQILTDGNVGCFVKSGKGTLNMTGAATLANGTCVQDGMLRANGELTSQVQVDRPGTVRGVGVIKGSINVEGTLAPGNSPGTLSITDAVTMHEGSALQIDIDGHGTAAGAGNYSRLLVGGSFTADGTLAPTLRGITGDASNAFTPELGDVYTVVQAAGGVKGSFDALQQPTAGLAANTRFQVFYVGGHAVELYVTPVSYATLLDGLANGNAIRAGEAVDSMVAAQDAGADTDDQRGLLFALAGLRATALPQVMQGLAGEAHVQTAAMAREASLGLAGDMADHLAESPLDQGEHGSRAWATLSQGGYRALSDAQASGFHSQQSRASAGLDAYRGDAVQWGVGLAHTEARLENIPASGNVRGNGAMVYGELAAGGALVDGTASWSKDKWSTRRADPLAPASSLTSEADGHSMAASVTARFPLQHQGMRIEPYVQAVWQRVDRDGFTEAGDTMTGLGVGRYEATGTRLLAGLKLGSAAQDPLASSVTYRIGAAIGQDFGDTLDPVVDATLAGESFQLRSPSMGRTLLKLDASGTLRLGRQSYLYGGLNSATGHDRASYGVNVGVRVQF